MLLFGHPLIEVEPWYKVKSIEDINKTPSNSTMVLESIEKYAHIAKHCKENSVNFACSVDSVKQAIIANALNTTYILCSDNALASEVQKVANEYLWSAKVISIIANEEAIEEIAKLGIDGVVINSYIES
ncbi:MAG: hypothetical protein PHI79_06960 [Sulfurovaceae bacterium]|nr:hypothetical protein [Sulfurovaceae bacterium]MDD5549316.1 hypothetical protein [Sulfurovaceae bacterium]